MIAIRWTAAAQNELADIWTDARAGAKSRVTAAVDEPERELKQRPDQLGEGDPHGIRRAVRDPIGIEFKISELDCFVQVIRVWELRLTS